MLSSLLRKIIDSENNTFFLRVGYVSNEKIKTLKFDDLRTVVLTYGHNFAVIH